MKDATLWNAQFVACLLAIWKPVKQAHHNVKGYS